MKQFTVFHVTKADESALASFDKFIDAYTFANAEVSGETRVIDADPLTDTADSYCIEIIFFDEEAHEIWESCGGDSDTEPTPETVYSTDWYWER